MITVSRVVVFATAALISSVGSADARRVRHPIAGAGSPRFESRVDWGAFDRPVFYGGSQSAQDQFSAKPEGSGQPGGAP